MAVARLDIHAEHVAVRSAVGADIGSRQISESAVFSSVALFALQQVRQLQPGRSCNQPTTYIFFHWLLALCSRPKLRHPVPALNPPVMRAS